MIGNSWRGRRIGEIIRESGKETAFPPRPFLTQIWATIAGKTYFLREVSGLGENYRALRGRERRDRGILDTSNR